MVDLDVLFRSIINFKKEGKETITQKDLLKNFRSLQNVVPNPPEEKAYKKLYHFILNYIKKADGQPELPSYEFIKANYEAVEGDETVLALLEKIKVQTPYIGQDFRTILENYNDEQNLLRFERVLSNSNKVASTGLTLGRGRNKKEIKGITDAISYFARETKELQRNLTGVKTEGQIISTEDSTEILEEYKRAATNPLDTLGISTWLKQIDDKTGGMRNTELWLVAAFTGHCKTTFCLNLAYRALFGGWNSCYVSLEQTYIEIRRHLYVLHACNPIFKELLPEFADLVGNIKYNDVEYGRLNSREQDFWFEICKDFDKAINSKSEEYGRMFIWQPSKSDVTTADIEMQMRSWQQELRADNRGDLELSIVDYITLMGSTEEEKTRDHNQTTNNIIKNLKRICLTFNNGRGCRVLSPFQMNRNGYREALANEGRYYLTALSNAHEAERSSDVILSLFKPEDSEEYAKLKICGLKNRRAGSFEPFDACAQLETGFIYNFTDTIENSSNIDISGIVG